MNLSIRILFVVILFSKITYSQSIELLSLGPGELPVSLRGSTRDAAGNYYHFGDFRGAFTVNQDTLLYGNGSNDLFLYKTDSVGNKLWAKNYGSAATESSVSRLFYYQSYLYGIFRINSQTQIDGFDIGLVNNTPTSCLIKLDTMGNIKWIVPTNATLSSDIQFYNNKIRIIGAISRANGAVFIRDSVLLASTGFNNRFFVDINLEGKVEKVFNLFQNNNSTTSFNLVGTGNFARNQYYLLVQTTNAFIEAGNNKLRIHQTEINIPHVLNSILIKTDTNFNVIHHKILNPNGNQQQIDLSQDRLSVNEAGDSLTLLLNPSSGNFEWDQLPLSIGGQRCVAVYDTMLTLRNFVQLSQSSTPGAIAPTNYYRLIHHNDARYYFGLFRGRNQAKAPVEISPQIENINIFKNINIPIDVNGPSISFVVKESSNRTPQIKFLGNHSPYEEDNIRMQGFEVIPEGLIFCNPSDSRFNPWRLDNNLNIRTGSMMPRIEGAPVISEIQYFDDGSKLIVGAGIRKSIFEQVNGQKFDTSKSAIFFTVLQKDGRARQFHRMFSSFGSVNLLKQIKKGNKVYLLYNFASALNQPGQNFITINNENIFIPGNFSAPVVNTGYKLLFVIDEAGTLSYHNLFDLNIGAAKTFDVYNNGDLLLASVNGQRTLQINGITYPGDEGFYVARMNLSGQNMHTIKIYSSTNPRPMVEDIQLLPDEGTFLITSSTNFIGASSTQNVQAIFSNGSIGQFQFQNQYPGTSTSRSYIGFQRLSFNQILHTGTLGPLFINFSQTRTVSSHGFYAGFINSAGYTEPLKYNGLEVSPSTTPGRAFLIKFNHSLQLQHQITFNSVGNVSNIQFIPIRVFEKNGVIYVSGRQNQVLKFGAMNINYGGEGDGLVLKLDSFLNVIKYFGIQSPNFEMISNVDVFNDTLVAFAATAITAPQLIVGPQDISSLKSVKPEDLGPINYIGNLNVQNLPTDLIYTKQQGDWHNPDTWTSGTVPGPKARVVVSHKIQVLQNAECKTVFINNTGNITLPDGIILKITGQSID